MNRNDIEHCVRHSVEHYLRDLGDAEPNALHELFLAVAEKPLLEVVLRHAQGNQSKAAVAGHQPQHLAPQAGGTPHRHLSRRRPFQPACTPQTKPYESPDHAQHP